MPLDRYQRERERAIMGNGLTFGIILTVCLLVIGLCGVAFVYLRG